MAKFTVGSFELSEADIDKFIVWCRLSGKSVRAKIATIVMYYMAKKEKDYQAKLKYTAEKYGLSVEDCYQRLLKDEPLGKAVDNPKIKFDWTDDVEAKDVDV